MLPAPIYNRNGSKFGATFLANSVLPLWCSRSMFDSEYLQVEVSAGGQAPLEITTDEVLNMTTYTCHICDIEVPKECRSEHNNGQKHQTCTKILDVALERARKHMTSVTRESNVIVQVTNTYFCEPCTQIVQNSNKIEHESSIKHLRSLKIAELCKNFLVFYNNESSVDLENSVESINGMISYMPSDVECKKDFDIEIPETNDESQIVNNYVTEMAKAENITETVTSSDTRDKSLELTKLSDSSYQTIEQSDGTKNNKNPETAIKSTKVAPAMSTQENTALTCVPKTTTIACCPKNTAPTTSVPKITALACSTKNTATTSTPKNTPPTTSTPKNTAPTTSSPTNTAPSTSTPKNTAPATSIPKNIAPTTNTSTITAPATKNPKDVQITKKIKTVPTKAEKKKNSQKQSTQLDNYLKSIMEKCNTNPIHSVEAFTDRIIIITAINGDKIKIPINSFYSFHNKKHKSFCKICTEPNVDYRHLSSETHMSRLMIPIEDKNGIRKLDDIWSHCILCNDLTENVDFHLQSVLHKNKLKHTLIEEGNIDENVIKKTNPNKIDNPQLIQEHGLIAVNESEMTCNVCEINLPNKVASMKNHVTTFEHTTKYNEVIEKNKLNELDTSQFYCIPCDVCIAKRFALGHCNGKKHCKHLTELLKKDQTVQEIDEVQIILPTISQQIQKDIQTEAQLLCFVCKSEVTTVDVHMNTLDHKKNYLAYLETNKLNEIEYDTFFCIPCNTVIMIEYLMCHCTSKKHKSLLKNFLNNAEAIENQTESQSGQTVQLISENSQISRSITRSQESHPIPSTSNGQLVSQNGVFDTAIPLKFLYQFSEMTNSKNLLCTICDEEVSYKKYEVQSHVCLDDHMVSFNMKMLWNKIKKKNDAYYCDVCKVDITYFNELSHITSSQHIELMSKQPMGTVFEYNPMFLTLDYSMSHKVGDRVRPSSILLQSKTSQSIQPKTTKKSRKLELKLLKMQQREATQQLCEDLKEKNVDIQDQIKPFLEWVQGVTERIQKLRAESALSDVNEMELQNMTQEMDDVRKYVKESCLEARQLVMKLKMKTTRKDRDEMAVFEEKILESCEKLTKHLFSATNS